MATPEIGFIKLNRFSKTSMDEFKKSLSKLKKQGMEKLILDLRGNSGGYLNTAIKLSDEFLPGGNLLFTLKDCEVQLRNLTQLLLGDLKMENLLL